MKMTGVRFKADKGTEVSMLSHVGSTVELLLTLLQIVNFYVCSEYPLTEG